MLHELLRECDFMHSYIPANHVQANPVEGSNRTLKTMITMFVNHDHCKRDKHLHEFRHAVNTAVQRSIKVSTAFLIYGRHPCSVKSLQQKVQDRRLKFEVDPKI